MLQAGLVLIIGFFLLIKGADLFVEGASGLALIFKVPPIVIGLTIVSFGTSTPEISVSIQSALAGSSDLALGNVIGSNIFNVLACVGLSTLAGNLLIPISTHKKDIPFMIIVSLIFLVFLITGLTLNRIEAIILLIILAVYIVDMLLDTYRHKVEDTSKPHTNLLKSIVLISIGLLAIISGGDFVTTSAKTIALNLGLSETLIGLTIVAIGTSLPELLTSVIATKKGQTEIAIGNVVGSNILNILFILGVSAAITPVFVDPKLLVDTGIMIAVFLLLYFACRNKKVSKKEGFVFLLLFIIYNIYIIVRN